MKIGALLGWGIVIYAIMFLTWSGLVTYGLIEGIFPKLLSLFVLVVVSLIAGRSLRFNSWRDILPYSFAWGIAMIALDAVFSVPFSGWAIYADWNVWFGYALVVIVPLFAPWFQLHRLSDRLPPIPKV